MSSIVENQRRSFLASALDDARRLTSSLANLSDAQRAAILAVVAADTSTPLDLVFITSEPGDRAEIQSVLDGVLTRGDQPHTYQIGSGCELCIVAQPGESTPHE